MSKLTFTEFKHKIAEEWAEDEVNEASHWATRNFLIHVVTEYFLAEMPDNLKDFKERYMYEKGYEEGDIGYNLEGVEDEDTRN